MKKEMRDFLDDDLCLCALNTILGDKPRIANSIISSLGSASAVFDLSIQELRSIFPKGSSLPYVIKGFDMKKLRENIEEAKQQGITFVNQKSKSYPTLLRQCDDRSCGLFTTTSEDLSSWDIHMMICISPTSDRKAITRPIELIYRLLENNTRPLVYIQHHSPIDIKMALALSKLGTDIAIIPETDILSFKRAHTKELDIALSQNTKTLVFNDIPLGNAPTQQKQERAFRVGPGACHATILFNGAYRSRSERCGHLAFSYDRDLFAFPGDIDDETFKGNNKLIATFCAETVTSLNWLVWQLKNRPYHCRY